MRTKQILIIDDDKDFTKSLKATLEEKDYLVETANDSNTGMEKLRVKKPDLLLLDVMMETNLEGHKIAHNIKSHPDYSDLPILIITGMKDSLGVNIRDAFEDIKGLPGVYLMDKPFETDELLSRMNELLLG